MTKSDISRQTTVEVDGELTFNGTTIKNPEKGIWNVHAASNAVIYLHNSVGIEAAMKLFIWEDLNVKRAQVKITSNQHGRVVGVVVKSLV